LPIVKTSSWARRATSRAAAALLLVACGGSSGGPSGIAPPGASTAASGAPVAFEYDSLDDRPVSADATRGKPTVLTFVTTGSLPAQAQVDFLVAMAGRDADRTNYAVVALDPRENRELVELYRKALKVPFPMAMADDLTRSGSGPFGDVTVVPVTLVLDRAGRIVARIDGRVARSDELRTALRGL
jgi:hypothetical protein